MPSIDPVCAYCGKPGKLDRDHVVPRSRGGPDTAVNIVMACEPCNSSKGNATAGEWLGDRCPPAVLAIEARVNERLRRSFAHRDKKKKPKKDTLFAFSIGPEGKVDYMGEIVSEQADTYRVEVVNAFASFFGIWDLSGELKDIPKSSCRVFRDKESCHIAATRLIESRRQCERQTSP